MQKFEGVANTLFVPLVARINISKRFPEYFYDPKALELEPMLPDDATKGPLSIPIWHPLPDTTTWTQWLWIISRRTQCAM